MILFILRSGTGLLVGAVVELGAAARTTASQNSRRTMISMRKTIILQELYRNGMLHHASRILQLVWQGRTPPEHDITEAMMSC